jgi:hypothetical protein
MISAATSGWQRVQGALSIQAQARLILDQITLDLESAVFRPNGGVWFAFSVVTAGSAGAYLSDHGWQHTTRATLPTHTKLIKPDSSDTLSLDLDTIRLADARYGQPGGWLRFFTSYPDSNTSIATLSAPTAVAYQIARRNVSGTLTNNPETNAAEIRYQFFRSVVRTTGPGPDQAFGSFEVGFSLNELEYHDSNGGIGNPGSVTRPNSSSLLGNNVIDFGLRLYVTDGGGLRLVFPADGSGNLADHTVDPDHYGTTAIGGDSGRFPDVVEVMVRILTDEGARQIQNLESGRIEGDWWSIAEAHSKVFTRRIVVLSRGISP